MRSLVEYINESCEPIFEMSCMNRYTKSGPMTANKVKIEMHSNDHNPPHVHVLFDDFSPEFMEKIRKL